MEVRSIGASGASRIPVGRIAGGYLNRRQAIASRAKPVTTHSAA